MHMPFRPRKKVALLTMDGTPRESLMTILVNGSWQITHINSAAQLTQWTEESLPSAVLVDAVNADVDSSFILSLLSSRPNEIPITVIIARTDVALMTKLISEGADSVIPTSREEKRLLIALRRCLNETAAHIQF
jgi:DNA-binding NtrC family response regulator